MKPYTWYDSFEVEVVNPREIKVTRTDETTWGANLFLAVNDMFDSSDNLIIGVTLQGDWQSEEVLIDGVHKILDYRNGNYIYVFYHLHNDPNNENKYDYIKMVGIDYNGSSPQRVDGRYYLLREDKSNVNIDREMLEYY